MVTQTRALNFFSIELCRFCKHIVANNADNNFTSPGHTLPHQVTQHYIKEPLHIFESAVCKTLHMLADQ